MLALTLIAALGALSLLLAAMEVGQARADTPRARPFLSCGSVGSSAGSGYGEIRAYGLSCHAARRVINRALNHGTPAGWTFSYNGDGPDEFRKGRKRITGIPLGDRPWRAGGIPLRRWSTGVKTVVLCPDAYGNTADYVKPRKCAFSNADFPYRPVSSPAAATVSSADSFYVIGMRWRRWGGKVARAVGTYAGNMDYRAPAVIRLSRPQRCSYLPERVYSHFWIRIGDKEPIGYRLEGCA